MALQALRRKFSICTRVAYAERTLNLPKNHAVLLDSSASYAGYGQRPGTEVDMDGGTDMDDSMLDMDNGTEVGCLFTADMDFIYW